MSPDSRARSDYRGHVIEERHYSATGTSRIRRPDGSWRESEPTLVGTATVWAYGRLRETGEFEELGFASSYEGACERIDALFGSE